MIVFVEGQKYSFSGRIRKVWEYGSVEVWDLSLH